MKTRMILLFVIGLMALAACAPKTGATTVAGGPATFDDPFAYCAAVGTIDAPDARYSGPKMPEAVVQGIRKATGAAADAPQEWFERGTLWRCMDQQVYACFVGANLPCESKANGNQEPTTEMNDFCKANPSAEGIPAAVTGHETVYAWACKDGKATAGQQVFHADGQGYIQEIWYAITK